MATCDVAEMNQQESQNANGGGFWDIDFGGAFDYMIRDLSGGYLDACSLACSALIPGYGIYNGGKFLGLW